MIRYTLKCTRGSFGKAIGVWQGDASDHARKNSLVAVIDERRCSFALFHACPSWLVTRDEHRLLEDTFERTAGLSWVEGGGEASTITFLNPRSV